MKTAYNTYFYMKVSGESGKFFRIVFKIRNKLFYVKFWPNLRLILASKIWKIRIYVCSFNSRP